jgi:formylglycine-generating enzyme required for sulfatase activity/biopolymer transport protein ExbD
MNTPESDHNSFIPTSEQAVIQPAAFAPSDGKQNRRKLSIKPLSIMLGSLLLLGVAVVWFLFTAKSVIVKTLPQTGQFSISGGFKFQVEGHYVMQQGSYQFIATLPGYYPLNETIEVDEQQNQTKTFHFKKLPGRLTVNTNTSAQIWIDGNQVGNSNTELGDVAAGNHQIVVKADRYFDYEGDISITGMDQHQTLSVDLAPAWADVSLQSEPVGSQLKSGDKVLGETPFDGTLLQGEHQLTLSLPGYKSWQHTLTVKAGDKVELPRVYLEKADGRINLSSSPQMVSVTMDGKYQGITPIELTLTANQKHQLSFFKDGFIQQQKTISVASGEDEKLNFVLKPQLGQVTIHADQEDALLYVDDRLMGRANQSITLTAKQHKVVIKKDGYVDYETTVLPRSDLQQIVDARLRTLEQARWDDIKPQIQTVVGAKLKLFKPTDTFTMGASRREQGRRANEISRRIALKRPFYLGVKEISNQQYRKFAKLHSSGHVKGNSLNNDNYPVVNVSWKQTVLFCNWLSQKEKLPSFYTIEDGEVTGVNPQSNGFRLPTEAEWAWITRYKDGQMLKYAWGSQLPPMPNSGNFADRSGAAILGFIQATYNDKYAVTSPIGSFPPNEKGIYDLSGNAAEWMHDFYEVKTGLSLKIERDPLGSETGDYHVIRGSSWAHGTMTQLRLAFRDYGADARNDVGFRIARFVDPAGAER